MNLNNNLSIVIPTYNRAQILNSWLEHHAKIMYLNNIRIHVQDNASTDNTIFILENFQKNYSNITYIKNKINSGNGNLNMQLAMNVVDTKFTWPIGDSYYISPDLLNKVILTIKNNPSLFVILNLKNRFKSKLNLKSKSNKSSNKSNLGLVVFFTFFERDMHDNTMLRFVCGYLLISYWSFVQSMIVFTISSVILF